MEQSSSSYPLNGLLRAVCKASRLFPPPKTPLCTTAPAQTRSLALCDNSGFSDSSGGLPRRAAGYRSHQPARAHGCPASRIESVYDITTVSAEQKS